MATRRQQPSAPLTESLALWLYRRAWDNLEMGRTMIEHQKLRRGFASMNADRQRDIASLGGRSIKPENRVFSRDRELAAAAGRKGGLAPHRTRGAAARKGVS